MKTEIEIIGEGYFAYKEKKHYNKRTRKNETVVEQIVKYNHFYFITIDGRRLKSKPQKTLKKLATELTKFIVDNPSINSSLGEVNLYTYVNNLCECCKHTSPQQTTEAEA